MLNTLNKFGYVYMSTNNINGMKYIGQHKATKFDKYYYGSGKAICKDFKIYSRSNFTVTILEWCYNQIELDEKERYWIKYYNANTSSDFYNIAVGGKNNPYYGDFTLTHRQHISDARKKIVEQKGETIWINDGNKETIICKKDLANYHDYNVGRLIKRVYVTKNNETKSIDKNELQHYLNLGYSMGKNDSIINNISKGRQHYYWYYDDIRFDTAKELTIYLKDNYYSNIVCSTVTAICEGQLFKKYPDLQNHIKKIRRTENL